MPADVFAERRVVLDGAQLRIVSDIVTRLLPAARVSIFGSRATGRARPSSDLDLLVHEPASLSWALRADLRDAFEASGLPFRVDIVVLDELSPVTAARAVGEAIDLSDG